MPERAPVTDRLDRFRLAIDALRQSLATHSVTLLVWTRPEGPPGRGSATCVELRGMRCLVTAAHVVRNQLPENIGIVFSPSPRPNNAFVQSVKYVGGGEDEPLDIAVLVLSDAGADEIAKYKTFVGEERLLPNISSESDRLFVVYGTPEILSPMNEEQKQLQAVPLCYATISMSSMPVGLDPLNDIALEYPKATNISVTEVGAVEAPSPPGMSGGGIWLVAEPVEGQFWNPQESKLVGVQHGWYKKAEWVRGTQIQHGVALLNKVDD